MYDLHSFLTTNNNSDSDKYFPLQIAGYIQELLTQAGIELDLGLVQTAYANGSSTHYATKMMVSDAGALLYSVVYI